MCLLLQVDFGIYLRIVVLSPLPPFLPNSIFLGNASVQGSLSENQSSLMDWFSNLKKYPVTL